MILPEGTDASTDAANEFTIGTESYYKNVLSSTINISQTLKGGETIEVLGIDSDEIKLNTAGTALMVGKTTLTGITSTS